MNPRRLPIWVVAVAVGLHLMGMVRSNLPAQDGLKFLRFAREFHRQPWLTVLKDCDQHPLYPASIALGEPVVALVFGHGPDTWRLTGQLVSSIASVLLLFPLYGLALALFNDRDVATLSALLWALLPLPLAVGHDTLSDPLVLLERGDRGFGWARTRFGRIDGGPRFHAGWWRGSVTWRVPRRRSCRSRCAWLRDAGGCLRSRDGNRAPTGSRSHVGAVWPHSAA